MHDAADVSIADRSAHGMHEVQNPHRVESMHPHVVVERDPAGHEFHGEVARPTRASRVVDTNDVGVLESGGIPDLLAKSPPSLLCRPLRALEDFECDVTPGGGLDGLEDNPHAAGTDDLENLVAWDWRRTALPVLKRFRWMAHARQIVFYWH
jgi:hypothetical protein